MLHTIDLFHIHCVFLKNRNINLYLCSPRTGETFGLRLNDGIHGRLTIGFYPRMSSKSSFKWMAQWKSKHHVVRLSNAGNASQSHFVRARVTVGKDWRPLITSFLRPFIRESSSDTSVSDESVDKQEISYEWSSSFHSDASCRESGGQCLSTDDLEDEEPSQLVVIKREYAYIHVTSAELINRYWLVRNRLSCR